MMYLINWFQANVLMLFMTLILVGIPVVIAMMVFQRHNKSNADNTGQEA